MEEYSDKFNKDLEIQKEIIVKAFKDVHINNNLFLSFPLESTKNTNKDEFQCNVNQENSFCEKDPEYLKLLTAYNLYQISVLHF